MTTPILHFTGFEPFGGCATTPSIAGAEAAAAAARARGLEARADTLPVTWATARDWAASLGHDARPRVLIHVGLAATRSHLSLERVARNRSGLSPDNDGVRAAGRIDPGGAGRLETTLPVEALRERMQARDPGCEVRVTEDAGEYVCNAIYYHSLSQRPARDAVLFVHVPRLTPERARELGTALGDALTEVLGGSSSA